MRVRPARLETAAGMTTDTALPCRIVVNCTYSGLNQIGSGWVPSNQGLKHELTELALVDCPPALRGVGLTVMDGPFAETKEVLGGFYLIECDSKQEALEWAKKIPLREGGFIEVRPVWPM